MDRRCHLFGHGTHLDGQGQFADELGDAVACHLSSDDRAGVVADELNEAGAVADGSTA